MESNTTVGEAVIKSIGMIHEMAVGSITVEQRDRAMSVVRMMSDRGDGSMADRWKELGVEQAAVESGFNVIIESMGNHKDAALMEALHGTYLYQATTFSAFILGYLQGEKDSVLEGLNGAQQGV